MTRLKTLFVAIVLGGTGCLVPDVNLDGKACNTGHPCSEGFQCISGQCLRSGETPDAGATVDAGSPDSGIPASSGSLEGTEAFTVGGYYDDSELVGSDRGSNLSVYLGEHTLFCDQESTTPGWVMETDIVANLVPSFGVGTYPVTSAPDAGVTVHVLLVDNGGSNANFESTSPSPQTAIGGTVTLTQIAPDYLAGSFNLTTGLPDGGSTPLTGNFLVNDQVCGN